MRQVAAPTIFPIADEPPFGPCQACLKRTPRAWLRSASIEPAGRLDGAIDCYGGNSRLLTEREAGEMPALVFFVVENWRGVEGRRG